ncbi:MAG: MFS transporter, partial [Erysipelotrichaceae bacterium]|nr:MFS transporter [Erysipelotrichaceae bacterium]
MKKKRITGAMAFIVLMGIVSLFSDMTHEGARSVLGQYLNLAGASAATIGFVSGVGELCGYSLRLLSGFIADKTKKYWTLVIAGYAMQVLAIPALALIGENGWVLACGLIIIERIGKAVKKPAKNTLISFA